MKTGYTNSRVFNPPRWNCRGDIHKLYPVLLRSYISICVDYQIVRTHAHKSCIENVQFPEYPL